MTAHKNFMKYGATLLLGLFANIALAVPIIAVTPGPSVHSVGDVFEVAVIWDASGGGELLGAFDLDLSYDDSVLLFTGVSSVDPDFGVDSDGCLVFPFLCGVDDLGGGVINAFATSIDPIPDMFLNQTLFLGNVFTLFTVEFEAIAAGESALSLVPDFIGDETGFFPQPADIVDSAVCVIAAPGCPGVAVPEPGILSLLTLGLIGVGLSRRRKV